MLQSTSQYRLDPASDLFQGEIGVAMQPPAPDALLHRFGSVVTHDRSEANEALSLAIHRQPRAKRIPQEVESALGVTASPVSILAVNDSRLLRVEAKATLAKASRERFL